LIAGPASAETIAKELQALESEELGAYAGAFICHARGELARLCGQFSEARKMMREALTRVDALLSEAEQNDDTGAKRSQARVTYRVSDIPRRGRARTRARSSGARKHSASNHKRGSGA
jgi:hypothetical protein